MPTSRFNIAVKFNRTAVAAIAAAAATALLTIGSLVYAAGGDTEKPDTFNGLLASAAVRMAAPGTNDDALTALLRAADLGSVRAMWKLARMYEDGRGVAQDKLTAFRFYGEIADQNAEADPHSGAGRIVARSFVRLAVYYQTGIEGTTIARDDKRAARLLTHAATYFAEPAAQYELGKLYLEGRGVEQNTRRAANWLLLAARKHHTEAQCLLGSILLMDANSKDAQLPAARSVGLMWLELARRFADPATQAWVVAKHEAAFATLTQQEANTAAMSADRWLAEHASAN